MFAKVFALFAMLAVAFAAPNPKPQVVAYSTGLDYAYPAAVGVPTVYSSYSAALPYSVPAYAAASYSPYYLR